MSNLSSKIRVLLVDDQSLFVHSLARVIEYREERIQIVGIVHNGQDAITADAELSPDVILMDIIMPGMNGVEATRKILDHHPDVKIMMLTTFDEDEYIMDALKYGAKGYLLKSILPEEVIAGIKALHSGIDQISPKILEKITKTPNRNLLNREQATLKKELPIPLWYIHLSNTEREILELLSLGTSNKIIADKLHLAEQTVKNYISKLYLKMNALNRTQAVSLYQEIKRISGF